jgi:Ca-activated chloride channel family protein
VNELAFAEPRALWWLLAPAALLVVWAWHVLRRQIDLRRLARARRLPVRERLGRFGELGFWLTVIGASAVLVLSVARPTLPTTLPQRAGLDLVVLQDASASMRVRDVARATPPADLRIGDRWQRSMRFLRELGDALSWNHDRLAMVTFAHIAAPQIRLTRDPNTLFFFLDHLHARPPLRLEDDTTWDTNLEEAISWGLRVVDKDRDIHGRSRNATVFVMLSDGEAWSGEVAKAVAEMVARGIPLNVIGVGTLGGGPLPTVRDARGDLLDSPGVSRLERSSLQRIAAAGLGRYFELDRDADRHIASTIVAEGRRRAPAVGLQRSAEDIYWRFVLAAAALIAVGMLSVSRRSELGILLAGSVAHRSLTRFCSASAASASSRPSNFIGDPNAT